MANKRSFLIDTDTASDDAVALVMALRSGDVEVKAITVVAGNVNLEQATANALFSAEMCGGDVPVFKGAARPLIRAHEDASWFHGVDGMGNQHYPPAKRAAQAGHAVDAIIEICNSTPGLTLVTLGPLTNIALALSRAPQIAQNIARCIVMGGAPCCEGNVTPAAEYNIWVDPEAAEIVFRSAMKIEMVGWQLSREEAALSEGEIEQALKLGTPLARFAIDCNRTAIESFHRQTRYRGLGLPDPVAMAVALDPTIVTSKSDHLVEIETSSSLTRGMTVVDRLNVASDPRNAPDWPGASMRRRCTIVWGIDIPKWKKLLMDRLV